MTRPAAPQTRTSAYQLLIDGKLEDGASSLEVVNPASGKLLALGSGRS